MKVVGMVPVFNDNDIIEEVIGHLLSQGLELVVLDNGSTDGSYEICKKFAEKGQIKLEHFKTKTYDQHWGLIIRALYDMAISLNPDWVVRSDSDEFLESGINGMTLKEAMVQADAEGYNLIQSDVFDFFMTDDDIKDAKSVKEKIPYYSYKNNYNYRAWKFFPAINVEWTSHLPIFPDGKRYKIQPSKFVLRHYPFRNIKQIEKKIMNKTRGINYSESKEGLADYSRKILKHKNDVTKIVNHKLLTKYNEDGKWNKKITYSFSWGAKPPEKNDIFTNDGKLKWDVKTVYEMHVQLNDLRRKNLELRLRHKGYQLKTSIKKKFFS